MRNRSAVEFVEYNSGVAPPQRTRRTVAAVLALFKGVLALAAVSACGDSPEKATNAPSLEGGLADTSDRFPAVVFVLGTTPGNPTYGEHCTGVLVSRDRIVTAAHCISGGNTALVRIVAPTLGLSTGLLLADVHPHPQYTTPVVPPDLAWLRLQTPLATFPTPIELADRQPNVGEQVWLVGFGSDDTRRFGVNFVDELVGSRVIVNNAVGSNGVSPAHGDSGGPLLIRQSNGRFAMAGVLGGLTDGQPQKFSYTDTFVYRDFSCPKCGNNVCAATSAPFGSAIKTPSTPELYYLTQHKHRYSDDDCFVSATCGFEFTCVSDAFLQTVPSSPVPVCANYSFFRAETQNGIWRVESGLRRPLAGTWTSSKFSTLYGSSWTDLTVPVCAAHLDRYSMGSPILPPCGGTYGPCAGAGESCVNGQCLTDAPCICRDQDGDGFFYTTCTDGSCPPPVDCDDTRQGVNSAHAEVCGNGLDDDCSSSTSDVCPAGCSLDPGGILSDGSFANGWSCWEEEDHFGHAVVATDTSSYGNSAPSARVSVQTAGLNYEVQVRQRGISVVAGRQYRLRFWARASSARQIIAEVGQDGAPWANRGLYTSIAIGTVGAVYSTTFTASVTDASAKFGFQVGDVAGDVRFDDVRIEPVTTCTCQDHDTDGYYDLACGDANCGPRTDCDDTRATVNPGQAEICGNGLDNDCNSSTSDVCSSGCALDPGSVLADGDFSESLACWEEEDHVGTATATTDGAVFGTSAPSARMNVATAGQNFQVQLRRRPVAVVAGRQYRLTFWARASTSRQIIAEVGQDGAPWTNRGLYATFSVGTVGASYSADFTASVTDSSAKFGFQVGDVAGQVWFDDVRIAPLN